MFKHVYSIRQKIMEAALKGNKGEKVFVFHQVNNDAKSYANNFGVDVDRFKSFLLKAASNGEKFKHINEIGMEGKNYYLTLDDGYDDIITIVYPLLKEINVPFCIFITTDFIGTKGYLSWDELEFLSSEPLCTIGSHTKTHPLLRKCNTEKSKDEILGSKYIIESRLNVKVDYFAYPYGSIYACSARDIRIAGIYKNAFSTLNGRINKDSSPWYLPRITITNGNIDRYL